MKLFLFSVGSVSVILALCGGESVLTGVTAATNARGAANPPPTTTSAAVKRPRHRQQQWVLSPSFLQQMRGGASYSSDDEENVQYYHDHDDDHDDDDNDDSDTTYSHDNHYHHQASSSSSSRIGTVSVIPGETLPPALSVKGGETTAATDMAMKSAKWISFRNRAITAILMMAFLGCLSYYFKEDGLMVFTLLLQAMMYEETTTVIGGEFTNPLQKWWWFAASVVAWNGPKVMPWRGTFFQAVSYGMTLASAIGATLQLNWQKSKAPAFREYIRQAAVVVLSSILVVLPTSYWIATLEEFGTMWIFVPALYMIINDTMAYVGGQMIGKHALLPAISPKKTWEGFLVAAVSTVGVAWWLGTTNKLDGFETFKKLYPLDKTDGMVLAVFTSLVAPFGGFLASIIKRAYGQKDFGALLPGHGGLVDRLDCQMLLAPAVYFYLSLYKFLEGQVLG